MSSYRMIILLTLAITPSGALSPGPLSTSAVALGALMGPLGGFLAALGHMIIELPYVLLLYRFTLVLKGFIGRFKVLFNTIVVLFLLYFSYMLLKDSLSLITSSRDSQSLDVTVGGGLPGAILVGVILTGFNAYFLLWWLTVGYPLIEESSKLGFRGLAVMYISHVWIDYAWLTLLAGGGGAVSILGHTPYAILLGVLALILVILATRITIDTFKDIMVRPKISEGSK